MNQEIDLKVFLGGAEAMNVPVSGSVAIKMGDAPRGSRFAVKDEKGRFVPVQSRVLARWRDGSARWVNLAFLAKQERKAAGQKEACGRYRLVWGKNVHGTEVLEGVRLRKGEKPGLAVQGRRVEAADDQSGGESGKTPGPDGVGLARMGAWALNWTVVDGRGRRFDARVEQQEIEPGSGAVQATLALRGGFVDGKGERLFGWRMRMSVFAGSSLVKLEPMITVDSEKGVMHKVREMKLGISPINDESRGAAMKRRMQVDDQQVLEGGKLKAGHAAGWVELNAEGERVSLALRDFWQRWPKGISVGKERAEVELFPRFEAGQFAHMEPWYKYQYLFEGSCYKLKTGQARRWEMWMDLAGGDGAALCVMADKPAVVMAEAKQAMESGVWGAGAPTGKSKEVAGYDAWVAGLFEGFCASQRDQRDYGEMNWGDWFGERYVNWGNNEYDTGYELFFQAARLNNPEMHRMADAAARHASEVDVVNFTNAELNASYGEHPEGFEPRPGMMHEHCVGHVGGFYSEETVRRLFVSFTVGKSKKPYLCLDPFNLGHVWSRGIVRHYFLTGEPWSRETALRMGDSLARLTEDGKYAYFSNQSHSGRVAGWTLEALSGVYEIDYGKRYLKAMRHIVDLNLAEQNANTGGWHYSLSWGHCFCQGVKHVGEAGFLTAIRVNGLWRYHQLTGDKRIPEAIKRAVAHMNRDLWKDELADWRYTSCPASIMSGRNGDLLKAVAVSVILTGDSEQKRVLCKAWKASQATRELTRNTGSGDGKMFTTRVIGTGEVVQAVTRE